MRKVWRSDLEAAAPVYKTETEDLLHHVGRKIRAEPILRRAGSNSTRIEDVPGNQIVQNHGADEQQSGYTYAEEPPTTVGPGTRLPNIQVD